MHYRLKLSTALGNNPMAPPADHPLLVLTPPPHIAGMTDQTLHEMTTSHGQWIALFAGELPQHLVKPDVCPHSVDVRRAGWRRSADRTRLRTNSLLTGNFTGKTAFLGAQRRTAEP
jgi:hypothetical protein